MFYGEKWNRVRLAALVQVSRKKISGEGNV